MRILSKFTVAKIIILIIVSMLTIVWVNANAVTPLSKSIGIDLSKQCVIMIKNNFTTNCPTIQLLYEMNLDTSDQSKSGKFSYHNQMFQREKPIMVNHYRYYDFQGFNIFINPPSDMQDRIKMIFIESNFKEYLLPEDMVKQNNTRIIHKDRWIDEKCRNAIISSNTWLQTLPDTIYYMRNDCLFGTTLKTIDTINDNSTNQNITTSQKYKEDKWKSDIKTSHLQSVIGKDNSTNKSVTEDKAPKYVPPKTPPFNYTKYK